MPFRIAPTTGRRLLMTDLRTCLLLALREATEAGTGVAAGDAPVSSASLQLR
jgi:hypothetical protein